MMKKRQKLFLKKLSAILLSLAVIMSTVSCGKSKDNGYAEKELSTQFFDVGDDGSYIYNGPNKATQLTEQDIQNMNNGNAIIVYDDNHQYVTTIIGKFYEKKVTDNENALLSLNGLATLLGFTKGQEFFALYGEKNAAGYTHYTYQQRYGGVTVEYSTLRIFVDPEGYVCALQNSFVPELGITEAKSMSNSEAETIVNQILADNNKSANIYSEYTKQVYYYDYDRVVNCMAVYTDNPFTDESFDMPYLVFYINTDDGRMLSYLPTANPQGGSMGDNVNNDQYFDTLEMKSWSGTINLYGGKTEQITVPVGYNPKDGKYYLADKDRKIICSYYWDFYYDHRSLNFITSANNQDWENEYLVAYYNYIRVYDYYASMGIESIDGFGMPILLGMEICDSERNPIDNCYYVGVLQGWAFFGAQSWANYKNQTIDLIAHEYTHGIRNTSMGSSIYKNELGAIHEAFSDVMGQLIEYKLEATDDTQWNLGENSGDIWRNMANPNLYNQPAYVGDLFYTAPTRNDDDSVNDYGGVHVNSSLMNMVCYKMSLYGMTTDEQLNVWYNVLELMTPRGDYDDLYAALIFSLRVYDLTQYEQAIKTIFDEMGLSGDRIANAESATKPGCGRIRIKVSENLHDYAIAIRIFTEGGLDIKGFPNERDDVIDVLVPAGNVTVHMLSRSEPNAQRLHTALDANGNFFGDVNNAVTFRVTEGETLDLGTIQ